MTRPATDRTDPATVTAHVAGSALRAMAEAGLDWALEARRAGLPATLDPEFRWRVPVTNVADLFARGAARLGPDFPILAARRPPDEHTSPLGLYCRTRADGRGALLALTEHWDLLTDGWWVSFDESAAGGVLRWQARPGPAVPEALWWFDVADLLVCARGMLPGLPPFEVTTSLTPPPGLAGLGCRVGSGSEGHRLQVPRAALDARLPAADPSVRAFTERTVRQLTAERRAGPPSAVRSAVRALGPTATLDAVADALGLSTRTLHRRLAEQGTSFRRELDAVRAERARDLVGTVRFDDAAEVLGYSDARALRRAVRRWKAA